MLFLLVTCKWLVICSVMLRMLYWYFVCTDPLFTDPYVECLLAPDARMDVNPDLHKHCLATKFIDDKLLATIQTTDGLRQVPHSRMWRADLVVSTSLESHLDSCLFTWLQVVFLTDGMDTRPYRINWPASTVLFDVSPDRIFRRSLQKLEGLYSTTIF